MSRRGLAGEKPQAVSWWRVGSVVGLAGVLTAGLNHAAARHLAAVGPNWSHRLVEGKFGLVDAAVGPVEWLILGDSSAAHGVRPGVWTQATGTTMLNLATVAGLGVVGDAWQLQDYLDQVGAPKTVVLVHTADGWSRSVRPALVGQIPRAWSVVSAWEPRLEWDTADHVEQLSSRHVPLYAEAGSLVSSLFGHPLSDGLRYVMDDAGWVRSRPADSAARTVDAAAYLEAVGGASQVVAEDNRRALAVINQICAARGIGLVVVHAPVRSDIARSEAYRTHLDVLDEALEMILTGASAPPVRFEAGVPDADLEATVDHLLPAAAGRFTETLARVLQ